MTVDADITTEELLESKLSTEDRARQGVVDIAENLANHGITVRGAKITHEQLQKAETISDYAELLLQENPSQYSTWADLLDVLKTLWAPMISLISGNGEYADGIYNEMAHKMYAPTAESLATQYAGWTPPEGKLADASDAMGRDFQIAGANTAGYKTDPAPTNAPGMNQSAGN